MKTITLKETKNLIAGACPGCDTCPGPNATGEDIWDICLCCLMTITVIPA